MGSPMNQIYEISTRIDFIFAYDDIVARREAKLLNVKLTGTLGILLKAVKRRLINQKEADRILARMIENGFYSPVRSIKEIQ